MVIPKISASNYSANTSKYRQSEPSFKRGSMVAMHTDSMINTAQALANNATKQHFFGGNVYNLIKLLQEGKLKGISELLPSPITSGDAPHNYWLKNAFQLSSKFPEGESSYASLLVELYKNKTNLVSDGAFINTGITAPEFTDILNRGKVSSFKNNYTLSDSSDITLGLFSTNRLAKKNERFKLINSKYKYEQTPDGKIEVKPNENYDPHKPTFFQVYDKRYVSNPNNDSIIKHYDKPQNSEYEINSYRDSCYHYPKELTSEQIEQFNRSVRLWNKEIAKGAIDKDVDMYSYEGAQNLLKFAHFNVDSNDAAKGYRSWYNKKDVPQLNHSNVQVREGIIDSGYYWTKLTDNINLNYIAKTNGVKDNIENRLTDIAKDDFIMRQISDFPLASVEFGENLTNIIKTGHISKKAYLDDDILKSRVDININNIPQEYQDNYREMSRILSEKFVPFANKVLEKLNNELPEKLFENGKLTEYGEHSLPIILHNIAKYSFIKTLAPEVEVKLDSQKLALNYNLEKLNEITTQSLGIPYGSSKEMAREFLTVLKSKATKNLDENAQNEIKEISKGLLENTSLASLKAARQEINKKGIGLDWRLDAAKNAMYGKTLDEELSSISSMWGAFSNAVRQANPNSRIMAEFTDMHQLYAGRKSEKFPNPQDFRNHMMKDLGISEVCYSYWFSDMGQIVNDSKNAPQYFRNKMYEYLNAYPYKTSTNMSKGVARTLEANANDNQLFRDNNDQPKAMHFMMIDPKMFYSGLKTNESKIIAEKVIDCNYLGKEKILPQEAYDKTSSQAIAMAYAIRNSFSEMKNLTGGDKEALEHALSDLVQGKFKDTNFIPADFGVKPVDMSILNTIKQAKYNAEKGGKPFSITDEKQMKDLAKNIYKNMLTTPDSTGLSPTDKYFKSLELFVSVPGSPTITIGNRTGFESVSNNKHVANRNIEFIDIDEVLPGFKKRENEILGIRKKSELRALNDGDYKVLPNLGDETALLRETEDGNVVISVANPSGKKLHLDSIRLSYRDDFNPSKYLQNDDRLTDLQGNKYKVVKLGGWFIKPVNNGAININKDKDCILYLHKTTKEDLNAKFATEAYASRG